MKFYFNFKQANTFVFSLDLEFSKWLRFSRKKKKITFSKVILVHHLFDRTSIKSFYDYDNLGCSTRLKQRIPFH